MHVQSASPSYVDIIIFSYFPYRNRTVQFGTLFCRNHRRWRRRRFNNDNKSCASIRTQNQTTHWKPYTSTARTLMRECMQHTNYERPKHQITVHSFFCPDNYLVHAAYFTFSPPHILSSFRLLIAISKQRSRYI